MIAVNAVGAVHQLGFIHEDAGIALPLDVADLYRTSVTIPAAFEAASHDPTDSKATIERQVRRILSEKLHREQIIPNMIDRLKQLFGDGSDRNS